MVYVCNQLMTGSKGCRTFHAKKVEVIYLLFIVTVFLGLLGMVIIVCKRRLKEKMENELNLQVDNSIKIYLQDFEKK